LANLILKADSVLQMTVASGVGLLSNNILFTFESVRGVPDVFPRKGAKSSIASIRMLLPSVESYPTSDIYVLQLTQASIIHRCSKGANKAKCLHIVHAEDMGFNKHISIRRRKEMTFTTIAQDPDLRTADTVLLTDEVLRMVNHRSAWEGMYLRTY
jgi:hypothetical protein